MKTEEWPERDEFVVCTVKVVRTFGTFVELEEYGKKEGLIHISEISSGWVKHIRDYVREGQKVICKVLHVDKTKGHIDLSLKRVTEAQKRERIRDWKNEQKAKNWLSLVASSINIKMSKEELDEIELKLLNAYEGLYDAFEDVVKNGKKVLIALGIKEEYAKVIHKVAVANVKLPSVHITGYVELSCPLPAGVEIIKEALKNATGVKRGASLKNGIEVECLYLGAPKYEICVNASNYKEAESVLSAAANAAIEVVKRNEGYGKFYRNLS